MKLLNLCYHLLKTFCWFTSHEQQDLISASSKHLFKILYRDVCVGECKIAFCFLAPKAIFILRNYALACTLAVSFSFLLNFLGEPSKLKSAETWEKFPTRGGSSKIQKVPKFQLGKVQKEGGGHHISKKSQVSKSSQVWKIMHYFHLMRTLKQKNLYFFALKMANNTLILQIVIDFVSKVPIFKLFSRFWRGSFCIKMFPS